MTRISSIQYRVVEVIPRSIDVGILYVSRKYGTAVHKCCCGCGHEVVTPLGPTDWKVSFDRLAVSVYPSIGNWSLACRSHYWIRNGRIQWAEQWTNAQIRRGRERDCAASQRRYSELRRKPGFVVRLRRWLTGR